MARERKIKFLNRQISIRAMLFIILVIVCLTPLITPPIALFLGLVTAQLIGHPFLHLNKKATTVLLQVSVVGLGFGMNVNSALKAGREGIVFSIVSIFGTLVLGTLLGRLLKMDKKTAHLVACGTAICGGSAIAAVSPVIHADEKQISVALGTVFILNSVALFLFPLIGHSLHLNETQFGLWCAIAIHDTSSVVGAAGKFGAHALEVATTVKLVRALWIIPVTIGTSLAFKNKTGKVKIPYFIGWFVVAMVLNTYVPGTNIISPIIVTIAKTGLTLTLFLIGAGLSKNLLKSVGVRPLLQGVILWVVISVAALWVISMVV